jgi:hypothetical protein
MADPTTATVVVVAGSVVFLIGASIGVPRVFTEPDADERLRMLDAGRSRWRAAQPMYAAGALITAIGVGVRAASMTDAPRVGLALSCVLLVVGALCWSASVFARGRDIEGFVRGTLPHWPFPAYVWLTLAGLVALGAGLLVSDVPAWTGWLAVVAAVVFAAAFVRFRDIPPFVFYLLLPVVSLGWL